MDSLGRFRTGKVGIAWIVALIEGGEPDSSLIEAFANVGPVIESFVPNTTVSIRDSVVFNLIAHDADGVVRTVVWRLGKDTAVQVRDTVEKSIVQRSRSQAFGRIVMWKWDDDGNVGTDYLLIDITNSPLVLFGLSPRDTVASIRATGSSSRSNRRSSACNSM